MTKKTYADKPVESWSTNDFIAYLADRHLELYGTEYLPPGRNWQVERGLIGNLIGTKGKNAKPRKYEPAVVKAFIDECYRIHKCSAQYPTVNYTWFWKWKTDVWAKVLKADADIKRKAERVSGVEEVGLSAEEIDGWL